jgi:hypothetical protein
MPRGEDTPPAGPWSLSLALKISQCPHLPSPQPAFTPFSLEQGFWEQSQAQGSPCPQRPSPHNPSQVLLRSGSPAPAEPVDPNRGLRALTQEEVISEGGWSQGGTVTPFFRVVGPGIL